MELKGTRKKIYEYISEHPGSHFREISRNMEIAIGDLQYHVDHLEAERYIVSERRGFYKRFYPTRQYNEQQKKIISALNRETPRKILLLLSRNPGAFQHEVTGFVKLSSPTVSWNMKKLIEDGLVMSVKEGRSTHYYLTAPEAEVEEALKTFHSKFWMDWADRFTDIWMDISTVKEKEEDEK